MAFDFLVAQSSLLPDVLIIEPSAFTESRGVIWTSYSQDLSALPAFPQISFNHDKFSISKKNVLRGIHGDAKSWKLVSCVAGNIFQVVVDMRESSATFLKHQVFELSGMKPKSVLIPPGFGNAFLVLSDSATYHYKLSYQGDYIDADQQFTVAWDDPRLDIDWPIEAPILSERDSRD